jgi:DNA polymerase
MALRYPKLTFELDEKSRKQWFYGPDKTKLYGAKLVENIVQAVARCVMTDGMLRIQNRYPCVLTVHDEAVVLVPTKEVVEAEPWVLAQMVKQPSYMPDIPLAAETGSGARYGQAK